MKRTLILDRIVFLLTGIIAGYQITSGMDQYNNVTTFYLTISFGVLLLACLSFLLLGFEIIENDFIAVIASLIPISLSLGIVNSKFPHYHIPYLVIILIGFTAAIYFRFYGSKRTTSLSLALIHGVSGVVIFLLPLILLTNSSESLQLGFVSVGGVLIGLSGMLLAFAKSGKPIIGKELLLLLFPIILFLTTAAFVMGLAVN